MITKRLLALEVVLLLGLSGVFLVPNHPKIFPSAVKLELPAMLGQWEGEDTPITEREYQVLARDTEFARKIYRNAFGDQIFVSIVMSGQDLDNSIHRPERCLPAQGWTIADSRTLRLPVPSMTSGRLEVTRLHNMRTIRTDAGEMVKLYNLNYFWFVGNKDLTSSHFRRTFIDIRDRILHGYNQRWAYVTVAGTITENLVKYGKTEAQTDEMLQGFIKDLVPKIIAPPSSAGLAPRD
jgi:EpsI family protein